MPEEYKMELPEGVIATVTEIPEVVPESESMKPLATSLPEVVDPADAFICESCE